MVVERRAVKNIAKRHFEVSLHVYINLRDGVPAKFNKKDGLSEKQQVDLLGISYKKKRIAYRSILRNDYTSYFTFHKDTMSYVLHPFSRYDRSFYL